MKKELKTEAERIAYNCRKATFLIEKQQDVKLSVKEKMELEIHLAGCYICRVYEQQSILINRMMKNIFRGKSRELKLDSTFKENLQKSIDEKIARKL